jgi:outer membrane usher protein
MAYQNGQVYARLPDASGTLFIRWDNKQTCRVNYQMPARNQASGNNFIHLNGICVQ